MEILKLQQKQAPYIRSKQTTQSVMLDVIIAMLPAFAFSVYYFGIRAFILVVVTVVAAVLSEVIMQKLLNKKIRVKDLSAVVTGMLLAFNFPVEFPYWMAIVSAIFAIVVGKELFGGIGRNFINPALAGRAFVMLTWPQAIGTFTVDGVASATPLAGKPVEFLDLFLGKIPGVIGEVSKLAILIGLAYLLFKKIINIRIPLVYFVSCAILLFLFGFDLEDTLFQLFSGGIIFAAVFMLTDYSSSPMSPNGQIIYAFGAALITCVIRVFGSLPEGVTYGVLIMNVFVPTIDRFIRPRVFGVRKGKK